MYLKKIIKFREAPPCGRGASHFGRSASCAMHSRLKAAPTITLSEREMLRCGCVRTYLQEVTFVLAGNRRITDKQTLKRITTCILIVIYPGKYIAPCGVFFLPNYLPSGRAMCYLPVPSERKFMGVY